MVSRKNLVLFIFIFFLTNIFAQNFSKTWNQYFSYSEISALDQSNEKIYAATENAIFTYDKLTNEIETISTIEGLSGDEITSLLYISERDILIIGFENGLIQVYNETTKSVLNVVDIVNKQSILPDKKRINNFFLYQDIIYVSADFGISEYDIINLEFGDTFFIGNNGSQLKTNEITVFEDYIYAATASGIRRADINNPNLIDYQQWQIRTSAHFTQIDKVGDKLYAAATNRRVYEIDYPTLTIKEAYPRLILDMSTKDSKLMVTTVTTSKLFDNSYSEIAVFNASDYNNTDFTKAIVSDNDDIFIGSKRQIVSGQEGYGLLKSNINTNELFEEIHPSGPIVNLVFQLEVSSGQVWAVHGDFGGDYGFSGFYARTGISRFLNNTWVNTPYASILASVANNPFFINTIAINKFNTNKAFACSNFTTGLLEFENNEVINVYNETNSSIEKLPANSRYYLTASSYDNDDNLWVTNGRGDKGLNRFKDGVWQGIDLSARIPLGSNKGFAEIEFDNSGNVFLASSNYGVVSYNPATGVVNNIQDDENNMPNNDVRALRTDKNNQIWVGTIEGLRVILDPDAFANGSAEVESIIFSEDGLGTELFFQQYINDIEVDGTNNKWVGTFDNGVYYLSPDGQETIYHFTKDNSPLPSNDILDIEINENTGEVFFATDKGMVAFKGTSSLPQMNLENAYIYPNPARPGFNFDGDKIKITSLTANVNIKIVDIEGNLVAEAESRSNGKFKGFNLEIDGGTALWNGRNLANQIVASGVYVILLNDLDSFETKVLKAMIVR